jgi:hypothetical protein
MSDKRASMNNETATVLALGLLVAGSIIYFFFFGLGNYNYGITDKLPDKNQGNEYVYGGGPDSVPRQTLLTYPDPADGVQRSNAIREKLYGGKETKKIVDSLSVPTDSTQADTTKK